MAVTVLPRAIFACIGEKTVWAQFALRETWNAVCLGPMFDFLCEDGHLWQFVNR